MISSEDFLKKIKNDNKANQLNLYIKDICYLKDNGATYKQIVEFLKLNGVSAKENYVGKIYRKYKKNVANTANLLENKTVFENQPQITSKQVKHRKIEERPKVTQKKVKLEKSIDNQENEIDEYFNDGKYRDKTSVEKFFEQRRKDQAVVKQKEIEGYKPPKWYTADADPVEMIKMVDEDNLN